MRNNVINPSKLRILREYCESKYSSKIPRRERLIKSMANNQFKRNALSNSWNRINYPFQKLVEEKGKELSDILLPMTSKNSKRKGFDVSLWTAVPKNFKLKLPNFNSVNKNRDSLFNFGSNEKLSNDLLGRNYSVDQRNSRTNKHILNSGKRNLIMKSNDSFDSLGTYHNFLNSINKQYEFKIGIKSDEEKLIKHVYNDSSK